MKNYPVTWLLVLMMMFVLQGCALLQPRLEQPGITITSLQLLPSQGIQQRIAVGLMITNPNDRDLSLKGISYTIGIEKFAVLSGVTNQLPKLKAYEQTPVTLEVSANLLELVRLIDHLSRGGAREGIGYQFDAKLDFSDLLPSMRIRESGQVPFSKL
jgi:LEA14-like dessication related protein